jgi:hypothetical protein
VKHINRYRYFLFSLTAVMIVAACKTPKATPVVLPEKTAFYTIEATRDTVKQLTTFQVLKVTVVDTKINYRADEAKAKSRDYLKFEIITKNGSPVIAYSEHPLFRKFDLYEETGEISSKLISLPKGQVTLRVPYHEDYASLKVTETINFKAGKPVIIRHEK